MLDRARAYAVAAHGDQQYGSRPYIHHLEAVVSLLAPYGERAQLIGYLHDVVEDTDVTSEQLAREFDEFVARCVAILSDEPGATRKEKKQKTYAKMAQVQGEETLALLVKAADRLANVQACIDDNVPHKLQMYQDEHAKFRNAVYRPGLCDDLWRKLDELLD